MNDQAPVAPVPLTEAEMNAVAGGTGTPPPTTNGTITNPYGD